jgi:hypothetical protein
VCTPVRDSHAPSPGHLSGPSSAPLPFSTLSTVLVVGVSSSAAFRRLQLSLQCISCPLRLSRFSRRHQPPQPPPRKIPRPLHLYIPLATCTSVCACMHLPLYVCVIGCARAFLFRKEKSGSSENKSRMPHFTNAQKAAESLRAGGGEGGMAHHQTQKEKACARRKRAWHEQHSKQRLYACRRGVSCVSPRISMG